MDARMTVRFGYTFLYVSDVRETVAFYEAAFGMTLRFVHERGLYAEMETGVATLARAGEEMAEMNGLAIRPQRRGDPAQAVEVALICDAPKLAWDRAAVAGALPLSPPQTKPWNQTLAMSAN